MTGRIGSGHRLRTALVAATMAIPFAGLGALSVAAASPPTIVPDAASVTVVEDHLAILTGTYDDPDGDTVTLTTDTGSIERTSGTSSGTWTWEFPALDGPADLTVTVSADDGTSVVPATFDLHVTNRPPDVSTRGPQLVPLKSKSARRFIWGANDVPADTVTSHVDCGSGTKVGEGPTITQGFQYIDCTFAKPGPTLLGVTASDEDGGSADGRITTYVTARVRSVADGLLGIHGAAAGDRTGGSVAVVDLNGDGRADVAMGRRPDQGVPPATAPESVSVVFGRSTAASIDLGSLAPAVGFKITSPEIGDFFGWALANAGDVNHDGIADLIIGAPSASPQGRSGAGAAYVVFGRAHPVDLDLASPPAGWGFRIDGGAQNDQAGYAVAGVGDMNHDGFADIAVSSPGADPSSRDAGGSVEVIFSSVSPTDVDLATVPTGRGFAAFGGAGDAVGQALSSGDVNGDGRSDLVVATIGSGLGAVRVVYGRTQPTDTDLTALSPSTGFEVRASTGGAYSFGASVAVGDLDHDGFADLAIGAPGWNTGVFSPGAVYVVSGAATHASFSVDSPGSAHVHLIRGDANAGLAGSALAVGDMNADGRPDLLIGAWLAEQGTTGSSYVVFSTGAIADLDLHALSTRWIRIDGDMDQSYGGRAVAAGDVNGDGRADVAIGAPGTDGNAGRVGILTSPLVDTSLPKVSGLAQALRVPATVGSSTAFVRVSWTGSDTGSGIAGYDLGVQRDGGSWTTLSSGLMATSTTVELVSGHSYRLRVRARDAAANVSAYVNGSTFHLSMYQESHPALTYTGTWHTATAPAYRSGKDRYSVAAGSKATFRFVGRSVAWVSAIGPGSGSARVYVDGALIATVNLSGPTNLYRRVVWSRNWSSSHSHVVVIKVVGTSGHPRVDVDALVTLH